MRKRRVRRAVRLLAIACATAGAIGCATVLGIGDLDVPQAPADGAASGDDGATRDGEGSDAAIDGGASDAPSTVCDAHATFTVVHPLSELNRADASDLVGRLSADERQIWFVSGPVFDGAVQPTYSAAYFASRSSRDASFATPPTVVPGDVNGNRDTNDLFVLPDELTAYFASDRFGGPGGADIYVARRDAATFPFGTAALVPNVNAAVDDFGVFVGAITGDLYFASGDNIQAPYVDLWVAAAQPDGGFAAPRRIPGVNAVGYDVAPVLSADERTLYFGSDRDSLGMQIHVAYRASPQAAWSVPTAVPELQDVTAGAGFDGTRPTWLSPDNCRLYFASDKSSPYEADLFVAERSP